MHDGVQIAVDVWLPQDYQIGQRLPVLLRTTRYGRDGQFGWAYRLAVALELTDPHGPGDEQTDYLNQRHFVEVSGSPMVVLEVASTAKDGAFFAYLEDVAPNGTSLIWMSANSAQSTASRWMRTSVRTIRRV
jgi:predicted acyl esterase